MYYGEIDECTFTIKKHGYVKDRFVGLPEAVDSAFRYIDGKIYFFKDTHVYVYDEFLDTIVKGKQRRTLRCRNKMHRQYDRIKTNRFIT